MPITFVANLARASHRGSRKMSEEEVDLKRWWKQNECRLKGNGSEQRNQSALTPSADSSPLKLLPELTHLMANVHPDHPEWDILVEEVLKKTCESLLHRQYGQNNSHSYFSVIIKMPSLCGL